MSDDLELKNLGQFYGSENYYKVMGVNATDGVAYVMENGYSWFITDTIAVIVCKLMKEEFLSIKLKLKDDNKAEMIITDGNENILYKQKYKFTNAKRELNLYYTNGVIMLSNEY